MLYNSGKGFFLPQILAINLVSFFGEIIPNIILIKRRQNIDWCGIKEELINNK